MIEIDYYERPEMSNSKLSWFINGGGFGNGISQKAQDWGHLFHIGIGEPHLYAAKLEEVKDRVPLNEIKLVERMADSARKCHSLQIFLSHPKAQFEAEYFGDLHGIPFKMKADAVIPSALGDYKSTAAKTLDQFLDSMKKYGYWRQAVIYMRLSGKQKMMFWGVSKSHPHNTFYIDVSKYPEEMAAAELEVEKACKDWLNDQLDEDHADRLMAILNSTNE